MISVVMPAYNAAVFIGLAIESILNQTFQDFELIIIDDGSTDNTVEIIQSYVQHDKRVRLIKANHEGIYHALNSGVEAAQYDWIARMDADDIALPQRFEKQIEATQSNLDAVVWGTYAYHINAVGDKLSLQRQGPTTEPEFDRLVKNGEIPFVIHPTALIKKAVLLAAGGYDSSFPLAGDFELMSRLLNYGPILAIPEPLLLYRMHSQSVSMAKFFSQQLFARFIIGRHQARLANAPLPSLEQFVQAEKQKSLLSRWDAQVRLYGQFCYRKAGLCVAEEDYWRGALYLGVSIAANPKYSIPRIWKQKLSPAARQALATSSQQP